jgi:hypothetical protein
MSAVRKPDCSSLMLHALPNAMMGRVSVFYDVVDRLLRTVLVGAMVIRWKETGFQGDLIRKGLRGGCRVETASDSCNPRPLSPPDRASARRAAWGRSPDGNSATRPIPAPRRLMFGGQSWQSRYEETLLRLLAVKQRGFNVQGRRLPTRRSREMDGHLRDRGGSSDAWFAGSA